MIQKQRREPSLSENETEVQEFISSFKVLKIFKMPFKASLLHRTYTTAFQLYKASFLRKKTNSTQISSCSADWLGLPLGCLVDKLNLEVYKVINIV